MSHYLHQDEIDINDMNQHVENDRESANIGFHAFFQNSSIECYFENQIDNYEKFKDYPGEIKHKRNRLIIFTGCQILSAILGMLILIIRRSFIYVIINLLALALALFGLNGATKMNAIYLIVHCVFTTSITGGFFVYQIFDFFLSKDTTYGQSKRFGDNMMLLMFSIPYLFDCFVGIYNYLFLRKISMYNDKENKKKFVKEKPKLAKKFTEDEIDSHINNISSGQCVICMNDNRNTVLNPCGHMLSCENCTKRIFERKALDYTDVKCPLCKRKCENFIKVYVP